MARTLNRLSSSKVMKAKAPGVFADGGNLFLQVTVGADGHVRRSWLFRYAVPNAVRQSSTGRSYQPVRSMGLGPLHTFGLAEARDMARECRQLVAKGIDPIDHRDVERGRMAAEAATVITFETAMTSYVKQHLPGWSVGNHQQFLSSMRMYVLPSLGKLPVATISTPHIVKVLEPIWLTKTITAGRVRSRIEAVLAWSTVSGHRVGDNPAAWRNHLDKLLAAPGGIHTTKHVPALPYAQLPSFMIALRAKAGLTALALQFQVLTAVRSFDVLHCRRSDLDKAKRLWTIPKFSKTEKLHLVPLSDAAMDVLAKAEEITSSIGGAVGRSEFVFCNDRNGAMLSVNAMLMLLSRMDMRGKMSPHGSRSAFRTWALECTAYPHELCELCLGHSVGTKVTQAYMRGSALQKRVAIMADWARFLAEPHDDANVVIPIHAKV